MDRRQFFASSFSASALAAGSGALQAAPQAGGKAREYYELRRYQLQSGPQHPLAQSYFHDIVPAVAHGIPAAWINRKGEIPIGAARPEREFRTLPELAAWLT